MSNTTINYIMILVGNQEKPTNCETKAADVYNQQIQCEATEYFWCICNCYDITTPINSKCWSICYRLAGNPMFNYAPPPIQCRVWGLRWTKEDENNTNRNVEPTFLFDFYTHRTPILHCLATIHNVADRRQQMTNRQSNRNR